MTWCNYIPNILQRICEPTFFVRYNMYIYTITVSKQTFLSTKLSFVRVLKIFLAVFSLITTFFFLFNYALVMLYTIAEILCLPLWLHNIIIDMCPNNIVKHTYPFILAPRALPYACMPLARQEQDPRIYVALFHAYLNLKPS